MAVWLERNIIIQLVSRSINKPPTYEDSSRLHKTFNICNIKEATFVKKKKNLS